jgi:hypothetical protein
MNANASPMGSPQHGFDRPGNDIMPGFPSPHWSACSTSCATNNQCRAYTYVNPGSAGGQGTCWLKDKVPAKKANGCCVSGVRLLSPQQWNVDRPGSDIAPGFDAVTSSSCESACRNNPQCKAYTFVKPGFQGTQGKCWLKNKKPTAKTNACCVSGHRLGPALRLQLPSNVLQQATQ